MNKPVFKKGQIEGWESEYSDSMPYQFVCYDNFNKNEIMFDWLMFNIGANMNWMVTMNGVILRNQDDAVLFALRWC